jgi:hypothetical protein
MKTVETTPSTVQVETKEIPAQPVRKRARRRRLAAW